MNITSPLLKGASQMAALPDVSMASLTISDTTAVYGGGPDGGEVGVLLEDLGGDAFALPDQAEQDVLGADVVVVQLKRLAQRELEGLLRPRGERDMPGR